MPAYWVIMARAGGHDALAHLAGAVGLDQLSAPAGFDFRLLLEAVAGGLSRKHFAYRQHTHTIESIPWHTFFRRLESDVNVQTIVRECARCARAGRRLEPSQPRYNLRKQR